MHLGVNPLVSMGHTGLGVVGQQSRQTTATDGKTAVSYEHASLSPGTIPADSAPLHEGKRSMIMKSSHRPTMGIISEESEDPSQEQLIDMVCCALIPPVHVHIRWW